MKLRSRTFETTHDVSIEDVQELADNMGGWREKHIPVRAIKVAEGDGDEGVALDQGGKEIFNFSIDNEGTLKICG